MLPVVRMAITRIAARSFLIKAFIFVLLISMAGGAVHLPAGSDFSGDALLRIRS